MTAVENEMLREAREEVSYADHKASLILAGLGVGFGALAGGLLAKSWSPSDQGTGQIAWWIGVLLAGAAVASAAAAVWPRLSEYDEKRPLYYWGDVAHMTSLDELRQRLDDYPVNEDERALHQLLALSRIVQRKYKLVRIAIGCAGWACIALGVSAVLAS